MLQQASVLYGIKYEVLYKFVNDQVMHMGTICP